MSEYDGPYDADNGHCANGHPLSRYGRCAPLNDQRALFLAAADELEQPNSVFDYKGAGKGIARYLRYAADNSGCAPDGE